MGPRELGNLLDAIGDGLRDPEFRAEWRLYVHRNHQARMQYRRDVARRRGLDAKYKRDGRHPV